MTEEKKRGWLGRLREGLARTASSLTGGITAIFTKKKLDDETLENLEELLIAADLGVGAASAVTKRLASTRYNKEISAEEVKEALAEEVTKILGPVAKPLVIDASRKPHVVLVTGVNGTGKTTTIGKLAYRLRQDGHSVMMAAGDTFRAAAIEQLQVWGERAGVPVVSGAVGSDAAGLAFDALQRAKAEGIDVLLIDTAGRLQNKANLMAELTKIVRVIQKLDASAPHDTLLVLDATTGQNAHSQVDLFRQAANITGLVMTKLDGTARGGVMVALAERTKLPIHMVGVGESIDDLQPFDAQSFARSLAGVADETVG